ncbi:MAG: tRNA pseudouridine(55) synthase TruB [Anaerolineales bacterium]
MTASEPFGLLVVDKPAGPTSHDVVAEIRRATGVSKVGHTGTLDPAATGVLVLCMGKATRLSEYLTESDKTYLAEIYFGKTTTTYDGDGDIVEETGGAPSRTAIADALGDFLGAVEQRPPAYSAIKVDGVRAYQMARAGKSPNLPKRTVTFYELTIESYHAPTLELSVRCSAGTYIRSLAHDLGNALQVGAFLSGLRRTRTGAFGLEQATPLSDLMAAIAGSDWERYLVDPVAGLPAMPRVRIADEHLADIRNGVPIPAAPVAEGMALGLDQQARLIAVLEAEADGEHWHPNKVFLG